MPVVVLHPVFREFRWRRLDYNPSKWTIYQPLPLRNYPVFQFRVGSERRFSVVDPKTFFNIAIGKPVSIKWKIQKRLRLSVKNKVKNPENKKRFKYSTQIFLQFPALEGEEAIGWLVLCKAKHKHKERKWSMIVSNSKLKVIARGTNEDDEGTTIYEIAVCICKKPDTIQVFYFTDGGAKVLQKINVPPA